jgi:hypothetical protein
MDRKLQKINTDYVIHLVFEQNLMVNDELYYRVSQMKSHSSIFSTSKFQSVDFHLF